MFATASLMLFNPSEAVVRYGQHKRSVEVSPTGALRKRLRPAAEPKRSAYKTPRHVLGHQPNYRKPKTSNTMTPRVNTKKSFEYEQYERTRDMAVGMRGPRRRIMGTKVTTVPSQEEHYQKVASGYRGYKKSLHDIHDKPVMTLAGAGKRRQRDSEDITLAQFGTTGHFGNNMAHGGYEDHANGHNYGYDFVEPDYDLDRANEDLLLQQVIALVEQANTERIEYFEEVRERR